ncbi:MAG: helix-turn-helix domain-containing protein [Roseovarius sp.]|uniref:helix-turn-helix domain-containing protein n=1 Tax=Roseovarius sp. TaxID=1486281 RepID=UPI0040596B26
MIGTRIRERRVLAGIRQIDLAKRVGISPSYLNLIEHNRRRIGGKTLLRLADALDVEPSLLSEGAAATLVAGLREAAGVADDAGPERDRAEEFAERFPGWAGLVTELYRRNQEMERTIETLTDRLAHDPFLAASLHEVISAVTAIRSTSSILVETEELEPEWTARFHRNINEDSARLTEGAQALVKYLEGAPNRDAEVQSPQDEMHAVLAARGFHFAELEREVAGPRAVARLVRAEAERGLSGPAQNLLGAVLGRYLEDARALPMATFLARVRALGPNPARLAEATGAGLARVFRRMAAMPEAEVGPVGLVICDASGTLTFRKPIEGFSMPRLAGACALWPLYLAPAQPLAPLRRRVRQAGRGGEVVEALAVAGPEGPTGFDRPAPVRAHMLLLPDPGAARGAVDEIGVSCRICPLATCVARREPSILAEGF